MVLRALGTVNVFITASELVAPMVGFEEGELA